jgi:hypothetical protein
MTTSTYTVRAPLGSSVNKKSGTLAVARFTAENKDGRVTRADTFRARVRALFEGNLKAAPVSGGDRAKRRKIDGTLHISIDEAVTIVRHADDAAAVDLLRAVAVDAGKGERVHVALSPVLVAIRNFDDAERDFALTSSRFLCAIDDAKSARLTPRHGEARRLRELEIGLEARANALLNAAEGDIDGA